MYSMTDHGQSRKLNSTNLQEVKPDLQCSPNWNGIIVEFSDWGIAGESPKPWKLNNILLRGPRITGKGNKKICTELSYKMKMQLSKLVGCKKHRVKGKVVELHVVVRKEEESQMNILCSHLQKLEQNEHKTSRRKKLLIRRLSKPVVLQ